MITLPINFNTALFVQENIELGIYVVSVAFAFTTAKIVMRLVKMSGSVG